MTMRVPRPVCAGGGLDGVAAGAVAGPDVGGLVGAPGAGENLDLGGDHEGGVEAYAELADEVGVFLAALAEGFEEGLGAGVGDGAEVLGELGRAHAESGVLDDEGLGLVVGGEGDLELALGVVDILLGELEMAELFQGVGGVGNELADEDLLFGVERVDDDIEQLLDFGLELVGLGGGSGFGGHGGKRKSGYFSELREKSRDAFGGGARRAAPPIPGTGGVRRVVQATTMLRILPGT